MTFIKYCRLFLLKKKNTLPCHEKVNISKKTYKKSSYWQTGHKKSSQNASFIMCSFVAGHFTNKSSSNKFHDPLRNLAINYSELLQALFILFNQYDKHSFEADMITHRKGTPITLVNIQKNVFDFLTDFGPF